MAATGGGRGDATAGARLGSFVVATASGDLPAALRHEAKRSLLNFIGAALGVPREPAVESAVKVMGRFGGTGPATLLGRPERVDAMTAAFVNAVAGNLLDFDDTHLETVIHPSAPVAPPALALAEEADVGGRDLLTAFVLGAEVACRVGQSVSPGHYARGWHITATCGVFGAAAAAARLLGLDAAETAHALGIAASESAGIVENLPSGAKNVGVGNAARNGLLAALLAAEGYTAAPAAIEGRLGWARAAGDEPALGPLLDGLGERWEFAANTYKPYPCGIVLHAVIDACLELRDAHAIVPAAIAGVTVRGNALLLARGDRAVHDGRDARISIHHCAAAAFLWGRAGVPEFADASVFDAEATALRARVRAELDEALPPGAATVAVETTDGRRWETTVADARGSRAKPLTDAEIEAKVRELAAMGGSGCDVEGIIDGVWSLDGPTPVRALLARCAGRAG